MLNKINFFFLYILVILLIIYSYIFYYQNKTKFNYSNFISNQKLKFSSDNSINSIIPFSTIPKNKHVSIFNLSKPLEPNSSYWAIQCVPSANVYVKTTLCLHQLNFDVHVSGSIWRNGLWEPHILKTFMDIINKNPKWLVIDVGAHIGQYSLFAAKLGRKVICVEPFIDNILRIHKAAYLEKLTDKVTLINNAISDERDQVKRLSPSFGNIGGQSLLNHKNQVFNKSLLSIDKYMVETILLDDIVDYLPKKDDGSEFEQAILKIDIEGFEPHAFQKANKLFDRLDISIIYMEWGNLSQQKMDYLFVEKMVDFLKTRNYEPFGNNVKLNLNEWKSWPWDVIWRKESKN